MTEDPQADLASVEERDRQWLATVYCGDKDHGLTVRAVLAGMIFGGLMSLSNLYVGLKSGWGLGVDIAAVVVIFAVFKTLRGIGLVRRDFGMMENTMTMTVAVAASWISSAGLVSAVPALSMLSGDSGPQFAWWQLTLFIAAILYLGLFMAIPLKRQMIQIEQLRFPANIPTGETLLVMYSHGGAAMKKATSLFAAGLVGAILAAFMGLKSLLGLGWIPDQWALPLRIGGVSMRKLTLSFEPSVIFIGIGAICGIKVGLSMLLGLILNYGILAPWLIDEKIITHAPPKIEGVVAPHLPLAVKAGQAFTVQLEEAITQPELPSAEQLKANPKFASAVRTSVVHYTWTRAADYRSLSGLIKDLNARTQLDGSPNPLHGVVAFAEKVNPDVRGKVLRLDAPKATIWEAKLSLPEKQPGEILVALGLELGPDAKQADILRVEKQAGDRTRAAAPFVGTIRNISAWSLWPGATILVVGGLLALAFQWRSMGRTFASIFTSFGGNRGGKGPLDHIEIPMSWFIIGFLVTGIIATVLLAWIFQIQWWLGGLAVVLTFFLAAVTARAGAEIGINPIGPMGKVTQLTFGVIAPGNVPANLMNANVTAGAACSCADTVGNLKVGHMVGANPRKQFIAQLFGVFAGALLAVPAYYFILVPDPNVLGGEKFPAPSALVWKGVAELLSKGLSTLHHTAVVAIMVAFVAGVVIVLVDRFFPKLKPYTPSPAALGMSMTMNGYHVFAVFLGSLIAWILAKAVPKWSEMYVIPIASGCIAGESIMAVVLATLTALGVIH
jgi:uncharacterized oligopeptide transporter (OPT) family protein